MSHYQTFWNKYCHKHAKTNCFELFRTLAFMTHNDRWSANLELVPPVPWKMVKCQNQNFWAADFCYKCVIFASKYMFSKLPKIIKLIMNGLFLSKAHRMQNGHRFLFSAFRNFLWSTLKFPCRGHPTLNCSLFSFQFVVACLERYKWANSFNMPSRRWEPLTRLVQEAS